MGHLGFELQSALVQSNALPLRNRSDLITLIFNLYKQGKHSKSRTNKLFLTVIIYYLSYIPIPSDDWNLKLKNHKWNPELSLLYQFIESNFYNVSILFLTIQFLFSFIQVYILTSKGYESVSSFFSHFQIVSLKLYKLSLV